MSDDELFRLGLFILGCCPGKDMSILKFLKIILNVESIIINHCDVRLRNNQPQEGARPTFGASSSAATSTSPSP